MGISLDDIVFNKKPTSKKATIIRSLLTIGIVLIVIIVSIVVALSRLGGALNSEEWNKTKSLLEKEFNKSDVVTFEIGALDENNLKTKLEASFVSFGELYKNNKINPNALFGSARLSSSVSFDKKDLTILANAYINYETGLDDFEELLSYLTIVNMEAKTQGKITSLRVCIKVLSDILTNTDYDFGIVSTKDFPSEVYVTCFMTFDNTKPLKNCIISSSIVVNNLSQDDNLEVLEFFSKIYDPDINVDEVQRIPAAYILDCLSEIFSIWSVGGTFTGDNLELYVK